MEKVLLGFSYRSTTKRNPKPWQCRVGVLQTSPPAQCLVPIFIMGKVRQFIDVRQEFYWWARQDSNLRQHRYERCVLTAELQAPGKIIAKFYAMASAA